MAYDVANTTAQEVVTRRPPPRWTAGARQEGAEGPEQVDEGQGRVAGFTWEFLAGPDPKDKVPI